MTNVHKCYTKEVFLDWFNLYLNLQSMYNIEEKDTYNMDEKGNALRPISSVKFVTNIENKTTFCTTILWQKLY